MDANSVSGRRGVFFMVKFFKKHWEVLSYLIFGVLTTLLNIVLYALFNKPVSYTL